MTSGLPFTDREKLYIKATKDVYSRRHIAAQLSTIFPADNGGTRNSQSVRHYINSLERTDDKIEIGIRYEQLAQKLTANIKKLEKTTKTQVSDIFIDRTSDVTISVNYIFKELKKIE